MKKVVLLLISVSCLTLSYGQNVPIDFEAGGHGADWNWKMFENDSDPAIEIVDNPDKTGYNTSSKCVKFTALKAGKPYAGCESLHGAGIGTWTIDATNSTIRISVWKSTISDVGIKLVRADNWSLGEIKIPNTKVNEWEQLTFDFSAHIGNTYDQIVIFPDFSERSEDQVIYFDNIYGDVATNSSVETVKTNFITVSSKTATDEVIVRANNQIDNVNIYTLNGVLVKTQGNVDSTESTINVSELSAGMYILKATVDGQVVTEKFLK